MPMHYDYLLDAYVFLTEEETRASLAEFSGQTLGIDEECRAQRMIECCDWDEETD
jgi:hypothetical protein